MEKDELTSYLSALEREDCFRVDAVMKESPHELTQRVFFVGANGAEQGPFVRKIIHRESGMGAAYERIFAAQQKGKRFKHVPRLFECYQHGDYLVVVMEFARGETLQDFVYNRDPSVNLAAEVFPRICDAVTELHEAFDPPLIHRDLKPSNVMIAADSLTIIDFGIARDLKHDADSDTMKFGTREFAPPEQFGFGQTTVRSDVYALGMILYFCLTESIPTRQIRDAGFDAAEVPARMRPVLMRATALDPQERFSSAAELKSAFMASLSCEPPTKSQDDRKRAPNRRAAIIIGAILAIALVALAVLFAFGAMRTDNRETNGSDASGPSQTSTQPSETGNADASADEQIDNLISNDAGTSAPSRNGFDPATNICVTLAGVSFELPSYFNADVSEGDNGSTYRYAESGSSLAMLMTGQSEVADMQTDVKDAMDDFMAGVVESDANLFSKIVYSTDCELAGRPARVVEFKGSVQGISMTAKAVVFVDTDLSAGKRTVGSLFLGQTDNALFDYSADFSKTIASATPA